MPFEECEKRSETLTAGPWNAAAALPLGVVPVGTIARRHACPAIGASDTLAAKLPVETSIPPATFVEFVFETV